MHAKVLLIAFAAVAASGACHRNSPPAARGGGPGPGPISFEVGRLSTARCEREERCGEIGVGKRHASRESCETVMCQELAVEPALTTCGREIDDDELAECMNAVRTESCGAPFMKLEAHTQCHASQLCPE